MTSYDLIWQLIDMLLADKSKAEETNEGKDQIHSRNKIDFTGLSCFFEQKNSMCIHGTHTDSNMTSYD